MVTNFWPNLRIWPTPPVFGTLAFQNGLHDHNTDFRRLNGNNFSTSCGNLVRFTPVTPEFTTLEYIQQASIITGVSSLRSLGGDTCSALRRSVVGFVSLWETLLGRAGYKLGFATHLCLVLM